MRLPAALSHAKRDLRAFSHRLCSTLVARRRAREICTRRIEPLEPRIVLAVNNVSGIIANGTIWANGDIQRITGDAQLPAGATLTIQAGAIIKFDVFAGLDLLFEGTVNAPGTAGQPIIFTSMRDDTAGGDTNGDGAGTSPSNGDWNSLSFTSTSAGTLANVQVRFGGAGILGGQVLIKSGNVSFANAVFRNSSTAGLRIEASDPTLTTSSFIDNGGTAVSMDLESDPVMNGVALTNNFMNGLTLDAGTLTGSRFWNDPDIVYRLSGDVTVSAGATLTVGAGQVVKVPAFAGIDLLVKGTLLADGTPALPIIFTSDRDDTAGGDTNNNANGNVPSNGEWNSIKFGSGSTDNVMDNVEVRFGGSQSLDGAIEIDHAELTLTNSVIRNSATNGVRIVGSNPTLTANSYLNNSFDSAVSMDLASDPAIRGVTVSGNAFNGLTLDGGPLMGSRFWNDPEIVYRLRGTVFVQAGATLTIDPGQVVKIPVFAGTGLFVDGTLHATGTPAQPITFTSVRDDTAGGDTNNDGNGSAPHNGDWQSITFRSGSTDNTMDNVEIRFGGADLPIESSGAIVINSSELTLSNSVIRNSSSNGVRIVGSDPTLMANSYLNNFFGAAVSMDLTSNPAISGVTVSGNAINGLRLDGGILMGSRFWNDPEIVYRLGDDVTVAAGATLTIDPGQVVKVPVFSGVDLMINGTLHADGTPAQPIVFTSERDDTAGGDTNNNGNGNGPNNGDWNSITFGSGSTDNLVDNVDVRFGGSFLLGGAIVINSTQLTLTDSIIRNSATNGVRIVGSNPTLTANSYLNNFFESALSMDLASNPAISGVTVSGNAFNGLTLDGGTLMGSRFWNDPEIVYRLGGDVTVAAGATLTIDPGQIVKVPVFAGIDLLVNGTLHADGTPAQPIVFTSERDDTAGGDSNNDSNGTAPNHGDWNSLTFGSASNLMDNVEVRFAGAGPLGALGGAIVINSAQLTLTNSSIRNSSTNGVRIIASNPTLTANSYLNNIFAAAVSMDLASNPVITGVTLANNGVNGLAVDGGALLGTRFWDDPDIVYRLSGPVTVEAGATLTVAAGQVIKGRTFAGDRLLVNGTLFADATPSQPIVFTSDRDDTAGGDTNNNTNGNGPNFGDWNNITFGPDSVGNVMDFVEVRYSGAAGGGAVIVNNAALAFTNGVIRNSASNGVRIVASNPTLTGNSYLNNVFGSAVSMDLASNPAISGVTVANNAINGLTLDPGTFSGVNSWDDSDIVYHLSGDVTVDDGATLTIMPGQIVKAATFAGVDLFVAGTLTAIGTKLQPIIFTSDRDDTIGGDTNNNGGANGPGNGFWNGITFISGSAGNVLHHAEVRYAGASAAGGAVALSGATATVTNSVIQHSSTHGLVARNGSDLTATSNLIFSNSDTGLRAESAATIMAFNSTIDGNFRGVAAEGAGTAITITNNLITNSAASGVSLSNSATIIARFNDVFTPAGPGTNYVGLSSLTDIDGNISSDPKYVSRALFNFGLLSGSGAIDAATSNGAPTTDFFGNARFDDPGIANLGGGAQPFFDIGAIERRNVSDPLNLVTENVAVLPANVGIGSAITITWTVRNDQFIAATGDWVDAVFASSDAFWSLDDVLVGQVPHAGGLAAGASYLSQLDATAPASVIGDLFFIIRADARQQLRESIETDNDASDSTLLDVPVLVVDTPAAAQFSTSGEADYYRVTVAAGGTLLVTLDRAGLGGATELYFRKDAVPTTAEFDFKSISAVGADQELLVPTTESATYYILALGKTVPGAPLSYEIEASFLPFGPRSVSPETAGNGGTATFIVKGGQLEALDSIVWRAPDNSTRQPIARLVQDNATVIVQFDLTGVAVGSYDLVLENNGAFVSLDDSVQVTSATASQVDVQFSAPSFLRPQRGFTATITYSNTGNNDAVIPLFFIDSNGEARLGLSPDNLLGTKIDVIPPPRSGPAGILKPGESASVTIYGELLASAGTSVDLDLDIVRPDSGPVNLALVEAYLDAPLATVFGAANEDFARKLLQASAGATNLEFVRNMHIAAAGTDVVLDQPLPLTVTEVWKGLVQTIAYIIDLGITEEDINNAAATPLATAPLAASLLDASVLPAAVQPLPSGTEIRTRHEGTSGKVRYVLSGFIASESGGPDGYTSDHWVSKMAESLHCIYPDDTVKVVNWNSGSGTGLGASILAGAGGFGGASLFVGGPLGGLLGGLYGAVAGGYTYYKLASRTTPQVGEDIANDIRGNGVDSLNVSIYGHSLGAQTAGHAGRNLNGRLGNIVAFDAAGPEFSGNRDARVERTDAADVTAVNTSSSFGTNNNLGHTNYYPEHSRYLVGAHAESYEWYQRALDKRCQDILDGLVDPNTDPDLNAPLEVTRPEDDITLWTSPSNTQRTTTQIVASRDPNDITGPLGFGTPRWITVDTDMPFTIRFENDPEFATAPAQEVFVTQQLDADLDWSTFEFGQFGFGSTGVPLAPGQQTFATQVQGRNADGSPVTVNVTGTFDIAAGTINWTFRSLDPETGLLPADPFAGFLPVNDATHRGEGFVSYFVRPLAALGNNTPLSSLAEIVFDTNEEILTPEWLNTIDAAAPTSSLTTASGNAPGRTFPVSWQGTDTNGSGLATFDVFVSDNNGPFTLLLNDTTLTSTMFSGALNHTYRFFTVATDNVGFVEAQPGAADATIAVIPTSAVGNKVTLTDDDGDVYTVKLTGPGTLKYFQLGAVSDQKGPLDTISLENTKGTSELTVTVVKKPGGDGIVTIGDIIGAGKLSSFSASRSDVIANGLDFSGAVGLVKVRDVLHPNPAEATPLIKFGGTAADKTKIIARDIADGTIIDSDAAISLLKAKAIGEATISAPKISKLVTTAGGVAANVTTTGAIGKVAITGGDFSGSLTSLAPAATLRKTPALASLEITGGDFTGDLRLLGAAGPISVLKFAGLGGDLVDATIVASRIASLLIAKNVANSTILAGADLGADFALGGNGPAADTFGAGRIGEVTIKGTVTASVLAAGLNPLDGVLRNGDAIIGGFASKIAALTVKGTASADSYFAAGKFVPPVKIAGARINPTNDPRFFVG